MLLAARSEHNCFTQLIKLDGQRYRSELSVTVIQAVVSFVNLLTLWLLACIMVFESKFFGLEDALVTSGCHDTAVMLIGCIRSLTWGSC